ncbi:MAG TPA: DUF1223 domain-containing protein [Methylovirgula sp.]
MAFPIALLLRRGCLLAVVTACEIGVIQGVYAHPVTATGVGAVVELFTSQGCSSCPPADRLLSALARAPNTIALSFPIDYWDFIGWHDTLASPTFTARQKAYAAARGDGHVYTPQVVVDGLVDAVGSDQAQIEHAIKANKGRESALSVSVHLTESGNILHIDIGAGPKVSAGVYIVRVVKSKTVLIGRGENSGRSVTYTNVVRAFQKIGDWDGTARTYQLMELKGYDEGYVVFLQKGSQAMPGVILAAAKSPGF